MNINIDWGAQGLFTEIWGIYEAGPQLVFLIISLVYCTVKIGSVPSSLEIPPASHI